MRFASAETTFNSLQGYWKHILSRTSCPDILALFLHNFANVSEYMGKYMLLLYCEQEEGRRKRLYCDAYLYMPLLLELKAFAGAFSAHNNRIYIYIFVYSPLKSAPCYI